MIRRLQRTIPGRLASQGRRHAKSLAGRGAKDCLKKAKAQRTWWKARKTKYEKGHPGFQQPAKSVQLQRLVRFVVAIFRVVGH